MKVYDVELVPREEKGRKKWFWMMWACLGDSRGEIGVSK
jgi:hypothetical protein